MALLAIAWLQLAAGFLLPTLPHRSVDSRHAPEADLPAHWRNSPTSWLPAEEASVLRLARVDTERLLQELLCDDGEHCATSRLARVAARVDAWVAARAQLVGWAAHWVASRVHGDASVVPPLAPAVAPLRPALRGSLTRGLKARPFKALARLAQLGVLWLRLSLYRRLLWPRAALRRRLLSGIADAVEAEPPRGPPPVFAMPNFDLPPALFLPAAALYDLAHAPELLQPGLSMLGL